MKNNFNFTSEQIIHQNFIVSIFQIFSFIIWTYLSYYIYPLTLLRVNIVIFDILILIFPYLLNIITAPLSLLILQVILISFSLNYSPAVPIYIKHFPIFKHFTYPSWLFALSRALMHIITSFGLVF
ncbi:MFS type sugar transporter [Rickettsia sp. TH2014]|uniref:MFS type sugar transporter n=1 Tax=Rickettsia sp. TH2014 TaxID=1967503 RepID=UPI001C4697F1|nr:MFS type sugar transporter [Rickettsia sp. TH2014]